MKNNYICLVIVHFFFIVTVGSASHAQTTQGAVSIPSKSITTEVETTIERTAIVIVRHIAQARADIHSKAPAHARQELDAALRLIDNIRADLSTAPAKNLLRIARKHLEFEQPKLVLMDLPPIYVSLDRIAIYLPTDKAKLHVDRAKRFLENNSKREAEEELVLADKSLIIIDVEQPLFRAEAYVKKAQQNLAAKNTEKADKALQHAERRIAAVYTNMNSPLFQAKQNTWLAFRNYSASQREKAKTYLAQARNALGKAAAGGSAKVKEETGKLSQKILELEKKLANEEKFGESEVVEVWEKSKALAERSAAYLSAELSEAETTLGSENNLIEAKLHAEYAETYQITTMEPEKAVKELDITSSYLRKAAQSKLTDTKTIKSMNKLEKYLQDLKANPNRSDIETRERYESTIKELNALIQEL